MTNTLIIGFLVGICFGFLLEKSKVASPEIIIGQLQFRKFTMLKVFLTAIATGIIIYTICFSLGLERLNWKITVYGADIIGGLLLGMGIAIAGACPGTVFAQIGAGYKDSIATFLGGIVGAAIFIKFKPCLYAALLSGIPQKKLTIDGILGLPFCMAAIPLAIVLILIVYWLEKKYPWKKELR